MSDDSFLARVLRVKVNPTLIITVFPCMYYLYPYVSYLDKINSLVDKQENICSKVVTEVYNTLT